MFEIEKKKLLLVEFYICLFVSLSFKGQVNNFSDMVMKPFTV